MFRDLVKTHEVSTDTKGLKIADDKCCQTNLSFAAQRYNNFITSNSNLLKVWKRIKFGEKLLGMIDEDSEIDLKENQELLTQVKIILGSDNLVEDFEKRAKECRDDHLAEYLEYNLKGELFEQGVDSLETYNEYLRKKNKLLGQICQRLKSGLIQLDQMYSKQSKIHSKYEQLHSKCSVSIQLGKLIKTSHKVKRRKKKRKKKIMVMDYKAMSEQAIERVKIIYDMPKFKSAPAPISAKQTYRAVYEFFNRKVTLIQKVKKEKNKFLQDGLFEFFGNSFAIQEMADKRINEYLISALKFQVIPKIQIFLRFLGFIGEVKNENSVEKLYLDAMQFMLSANEIGFDIEVDYAQNLNFVPYLRFKVWVESELKQKLDKKSYTFLLNEMKSLKIEDSISSNIDGLLEFDQIMMKVFVAKQMQFELHFGKLLVTAL